MTSSYSHGDDIGHKLEGIKYSCFQAIWIRAVQNFQRQANLLTQLFEKQMNYMI